MDDIPGDSCLLAANNRITELVVVTLIFIPTRERKRLRKEAESFAASAVEEERKHGLEREAEARAAGFSQGETAAAATREEDHHKVNEELAAALEAAAERAAEAAAEARAAEAEARKQLVREAAAEREELEKELATARERAVKLEEGKWKRASEEAEARASAEQVLTSCYIEKVVVVGEMYACSTDGSLRRLK